MLCREIDYREFGNGNPPAGSETRGRFTEFHLT